jgi:hypothetical protein
MAEYAGYRFATHKSQRNKKTNNSYIRLDYNDQERASSAPTRTSAYATIRRLFVHALYPGGPAKVVVDGCWFENMGRCPVAGTALVRRNMQVGFNKPGQPRFTFLETCYQQPVAIWPYDPHGKLPDDHPHKHHFDVIDRNHQDD